MFFFLSEKANFQLGAPVTKSGYDPLLLSHPTTIPGGIHFSYSLSHILMTFWRSVLRPI